MREHIDGVVPHSSNVDVNKLSLGIRGALFWLFLVEVR